MTTPLEAAKQAMELFSKLVRNMSTSDYVQACEELCSMADAEYEAAKEQEGDEG